MVCTHTCQVWVLFPPTRGTGAICQRDCFYIGWAIVLFLVVASVGIGKGVEMSHMYMMCVTVLRLAP
jgi:hypothetical protein